MRSKNQPIHKHKLNIVQVNYNADGYLIESLKTIKHVSDEADIAVWIVDNHSTDQSIAQSQGIYDKVHYILNQDNKGFSAANNQALKQIKEGFILCLNPDTKLEVDTLGYMLDFMEKNPQVGAASCKVVHEDHSLDWGSHRGLPTPWASLLYFLGNDRLYHLSDRNMQVPHEVDAISGSFLLTKKSVLDQVGLFDEDYWLYGEDLDLCFRIKQAGFKIMYVPEVQVTHLKGISSGIKQHSQDLTTATKISRLRAFNSFYETMKIFYGKHLAASYPFFVNWLVYLAIDLKWQLAKSKLRV
ncbi:MAG: glycosyltransferase family 2 protein [Patescibacteria group bacterium]|nr:glycosyltransferase family 2 protein [Patescibacteria group bacterium]